MADVKINRQHGAKDLDEAKTLVHDALDKMKKTLDKHIKDIKWDSAGTKATLKGPHVNGTFTVDETAVNVELKLSFIAKMAKGIIKQKIEEVIEQEVVAKAGQ